MPPGAQASGATPQAAMVTLESRGEDESARAPPARDRVAVGGSGSSCAPPPTLARSRCAERERCHAAEECCVVRQPLREALGYLLAFDLHANWWESVHHSGHA